MALASCTTGCDDPGWMAHYALVGPSDVYPQYNDNKRAWSGSTKNGRATWTTNGVVGTEYFDFELGNKMTVTGIEIYETYAGWYLS